MEMEQVVDHPEKKFKIIRIIAWCFLVLQGIQFYTIHQLAWFNIIECYRNGIWNGFILYLVYYLYLIIFLGLNLPIVFKKTDDINYKSIRNKLGILGFMLFVPILYLLFLIAFN
jgi:hypothetical protein